MSPLRGWHPPLLGIHLMLRCERDAAKELHGRLPADHRRYDLGIQLSTNEVDVPLFSSHYVQCDSFRDLVCDDDAHIEASRRSHAARPARFAASGVAWISRQHALSV